MTSYALGLDDLQKKLSAHPVIRADFVQTKSIKNFSFPLTSKGKMLVATEKGIWWNQLEPFPMVLTLQNDTMSEQVGNQTPKIITADSNPQMFQFNALMRALMQADKTVLEKNFKLDFHASADDHWQLRLVPVTTPLDKIFARIELRGSAFLDQVTLSDKQGDTTLIEFSQHNVNPARLSPDEQQYFK